MTMRSKKRFRLERRAVFFVIGIATLLFAAFVVFENDRESVSEGIQAAAPSTEWWNAAWGYRKKITVTTGANSPSGEYNNYTVRLTSVDTAALVGAGKLQADCDDLRIARWNGALWTELPRHVLNCNTATTDIRVKLTVNIPASSSDDNYYLYYGNTSAGAPTALDTTNVYLWYDDATQDRLASYMLGRGDDWHHNAGVGYTACTYNAAGYYEGCGGGSDNKTGSMRRAVNERDTYVEAELYYDCAWPSDMTTGVVARYQAESGVGTGSELAFHYYASNRAQLNTGQPCGTAISGYTHDGDIMKTARATIAIDGTNPAAAPADQWARQALAVWRINATNGKFWNADATASFGPLGWPTVATNASGTDATDYEGAGDAGIISGQANIRMRNMLIRRYTEPEPTTVLGPEEVPTAAATTTIADGVNPGNANLAPGGAVTDLDAFTFVTSSGIDTVTAATVTLGPAGAFNTIGQADMTNASNVAQCTAITNPASNTLSFTGCSIAVTTTAATFKVRLTPKSHAVMPAPPGASYAVIGTVTTWTGTNTKAGTDTGSATVTIDNLSPNNATSTSGSAGNTQVTLSWTTSNSSDFSASVVLRWTASTPGSEVPAEGNTSYAAGNSIGTATVACVRSDAASTAVSCNATGLTNGTAYSFKIFSRDSYANYDVGVVPVGSPFTPVAGNSAPTITSFSDSPDPVNQGAIVTFQLDWNDADVGELTKAHFCKTNTVTPSGTGGSCPGGSWASTSSATTTDPKSETYTTTVGDLGLQNYYAFVCDDGSACSALGSAGTFTVNALASPITFRSAATGFNASAAVSVPLTINKPAGTVQNDVMISAIAARSYAVPGPVPDFTAVPAGWNLVGSKVSDTRGVYQASAMYWKTAGASEPANYTWTITTTACCVTGAVGGIQTFSGADITAPVDVTNGQTTVAEGNSLTHTTPSVVTTVGNTMLVTAHTFPSAATWTPPGGMAEAFDIASISVPNSSGQSMEGNYATQVVAGATGTKTATASNDPDYGIAHILALKTPSAASFSFKNTYSAKSANVVDTTAGQLTLSDSTTGTLDSITLDTRATNGVGFATFQWNGSEVGGNVRLQLATASTSSGPWTFRGNIATCGTTDWYDASPNTPISIGCPAYHWNKRYFRYRVELSGTARVDDITVNWLK